MLSASKQMKIKGALPRPFTRQGEASTVLSQTRRPERRKLSNKILVLVYLVYLRAEVLMTSTVTKTSFQNITSRFCTKLKS